MPVYLFHPLTGPDAPPVAMVLYADEAAGRRALGTQFPHGCDVWQGNRFVGRFHRSSAIALTRDPDEDPADHR